MPEFQFFLAGEVASKPAKSVSALWRNGHAVTNPKTGRPIVLAHDPKGQNGQRAATWTAHLRDKAEEFMHEDWPILKPSPVFVRLVLFKQKPQSWPKWRNWFTVKPDRDNCEKLVNDAIKGVIMEDDTQVVGGDVVKIVAPFDGMMIQLQWGPEVEAAFAEYFHQLTLEAVELRGGGDKILKQIQEPICRAQEELFSGAV